MAMNDVSYKKLASRLKKRGLHYSEENLRNKINRGLFPADFFLECMACMGELVISIADFEAYLNKDHSIIRYERKSESSNPFDRKISAPPGSPQPWTTNSEDAIAKFPGL
jgi:hypothetical protein